MIQTIEDIQRLVKEGFTNWKQALQAFGVEAFEKGRKFEGAYLWG